MKMIQIRNVPDEVHSALKQRAAREGTTMSDLLLDELPRLANRPSTEDLMKRIRSRTPVGGPPVADIIRGERNPS